MTIRKISAREILDSRGEKTIEVKLVLNNGSGAVASVPQGKSTGSHEARVVAAKQAVKNVEKIIGPRLKGKDPFKQEEIDDFLVKLDGTDNKRRLGANAMLGVSIACVRAAANVKGIQLWKHIRNLSELPKLQIKIPRLYINVINGGLHAGNNLDFQEHLIIPRAKTILESVRIGTIFYHALGKYLAKIKGRGALNVGDEGGYAPNFKNNLEPFTILKKVAKSVGFEKGVDFGIDAAGSDVKINPAKLRLFYKRLRQSFGIFYIEDPFGEEEFDEFTALRMALGSKTLIAGDDLTTTNIPRMHLARSHGSVNAMIIKPNQIGTVSEALYAVRVARKYGWAVVASHRSGETNDDFIADFAYGVGADGLKLGAPARGERIAKYNRLMEIKSLLK